MVDREYKVTCSQSKLEEDAWIIQVWERPVQPADMPATWSRVGVWSAPYRAWAGHSRRDIFNGLRRLPG